MKLEYARVGVSKSKGTHKVYPRCSKSTAFSNTSYSFNSRHVILVPARRSNQSTLKEISPKYPLEGLMLKLKLQYFGYLMQRTDSLEKTVMLGEIKGRKRRGRQDEMVGWHHQLDGHEFE